MSAPPWIKPGNLRVGWQSGKIGAISGPDVSGPDDPRQMKALRKSALPIKRSYCEDITMDEARETASRVRSIPVSRFLAGCCKKGHSNAWGKSVYVYAF